MSDKVKYTTYLAGAIEHVSNKEMKNWRDEFKEKLKRIGNYFMKRCGRFGSGILLKIQI